MSDLGLPDGECIHERSNPLRDEPHQDGEHDQAREDGGEVEVSEP